MLAMLQMHHSVQCIMHIGRCDNLLQSAVKQLIQYCCYCGEMATLGQFFLVHMRASKRMNDQANARFYISVRYQFCSYATFSVTSTLNFKVVGSALTADVGRQRI